MKIFKQYIFYLLRWQASTPILAVCVWYFTQSVGTTWSTVIANFIGGLIFFWVDRFILKSEWFEVWQVKEGVCDECGKRSDVLFRLVRAGKYDSVNSVPVFRCMECSQRKTEELRAKGIHVKGRSG